VPLISGDCPHDHSVDFFAEYWTPQYPYHIKKQGLIKIKNTGNRQNTPVMKWLKISGDNVLQARIIDGSKIQHVKAKLIFRDDPASFIRGRIKWMTDHRAIKRQGIMYSPKKLRKKLGFYRVVIESTDSFGNQLLEEAPGEFLLH
jgi:hypothetical protein